MNSTFTHKDLCALAVKWLKRSNSAGGHGCHIAVSETPTGWTGEIPDAIGFRASGSWDDGSVLVEVKMSRSDFLADKRKPHRNGDVKGIGKWRYYLCPEGLIQPEDLPEKWGLLYINKRGAIKGVVSPFVDTHYGKRKAMLTKMAFDDRDFNREHFLLVKLLRRVGDIEELNVTLKKAYASANNAESKLKEAEIEIKRLRKIERRLARLEKLEAKISAGKAVLPEAP